MADRLFGRIALDFPHHPKILPLSDAAFRCLVEAILWSRQQQTDGFLARRLALAKWSLEALRELCENDPDNPSLIEAEDGWHIHDFAAEQDTKAVIEARRKHAINAGRKGGLARAKQGAKQTAKQTAKQNSSIDRDIDIEEVTTNVVTSRPRKRGTRLPSNWMPDQAVVDAVKEETGATKDELTYQHRKFVDYWTDKTGQAATKLSWNGTWRNWMRTAHERGDIGRNASTPAKPNKLRALADLAAEVREMETVNGKALEA